MLALMEAVHTHLCEAHGAARSSQVLGTVSPVRAGVGGRRLIRAWAACQVKGLNERQSLRDGSEGIRASLPV